MRQYRFDVLGKKLRLTGPDGKQIGEREFAPDKVRAFAERIKQKYHGAAPDLGFLGEELYAWLDGSNEQWLTEARRAGPALAIDLDINLPKNLKELEKDLRHLPWELLCRDGGFLGIRPDKPFTPVRRVGQVHRTDLKAENRPLRVLFMACSPEGTEPVLHFEEEEARILDATRNERIEIVVEESGSLVGLEERLSLFGRDSFDVLHLTGHADIVDDTPRFGMEDETGGPKSATAGDIARAFKGHWPRVVFLSGCKTGQAPEGEAVPSLCAALVEAGAPVVLGWALPVGDADASVAAAELYKHLGAGMRTDEAVAQARARLYELESRHWHLLRLYADATDLALLVTPPGEKGRAKLHVREAQQQFLDAGAKSEVCPRAEFVGRRRPMQRCLRILRSTPEDADYHEGVLLCGMGGLGKSSLAARLCERLPRHRRLVWVGEIDETAVLNLLSDKLDNPQAAAVINEPGLSLGQRLRRLLEEHLDEKPALFVFDDFEQNAEGPDDGKVRLDEEGRAILKPGAGAILGAFLDAVRETAAESRVMVTCRYRFPRPSKNAELYEEALEHFAGADLTKKLFQLPALGPDATTDEDLRGRATVLAAGNPRLLERLDLVLGDATTDSAAILAALEKTTDEFREETFLRALLDQQSKECRVLLALLSVCSLPVDREAVEAIAGKHPVDPHLERAAALGLVETGIDPDTQELRFYVSGVLHPLLEAEVMQDDLTEACRRAAKHLYGGWWDERASNVPKHLEIHRLAMWAEEQEIAVEIAKTIATHWSNSSRFREAEALCRLTLQLGDDYRILHALARAEEVLGKTGNAREHYEQALAGCPEADEEGSEDVVRERSGIVHNVAGLAARQGDIARALKLWNESVRSDDRIGDVQGKATTLNQMAWVIAQQGDVGRAMKLWNESLVLREKIGDMQGKAPTLHNMAVYVAQQGDVARAMKLWNESLQLTEKIGNVQGKADTLTEMARLIGRQGDVDRALRLWDEALELYEKIGYVRGKATTLHNMAGVIADQGDVARALELWEESLELTEKIGDVQGKAATLAQMAWAAWQHKDPARAMQLYVEAARALAAVRAWLDLVTVLRNLGASDDADAVQFLAQAMWLLCRVEAPLDQAVSTAAALQQKLGDDADAAPLVATFANYLVRTRGEGHPRQKELQQAAVSMIGACAQARKVPEDKFKEWFEGEGLSDPNRFLTALDDALVALVPPDAWLFDRTLLAPGPSE